MKVLVCGSRDYTDHVRLFHEMDKLHGNAKITCVIEGEARGVDMIARAWALSMKIPIAPFPADWNKYGKRAGYIRNQQMLDEGKPDLVVAFYDGQSRGTGMMIELARKAGVAVKVIDIPVLRTGSSQGAN